jgi:hypothetical protein
MAREWGLASLTESHGSRIVTSRPDTARRDIMCRPRPPCAVANAPDHAACVVASHPEQGWSLLCNGMVVFDDTGGPFPGGHSSSPRRRDAVTAVRSVMKPELSATDGATHPRFQDGSCATVYLAVLLPPGMTPSDAQFALAGAARKTTADGRRVRYVHGMYLPAQARMLCVFTAENEEAVYAAARLAQLSFTRIDAPPSQSADPPVG